MAQVSVCTLAAAVADISTDTTIGKNGSHSGINEGWLKANPFLCGWPRRMERRQSIRVGSSLRAHRVLDLFTKEKNQ
jgi:hypothetical protein